MKEVLRRMHIIVIVHVITLALVVPAPRRHLLYTVGTAVPIQQVLMQI